jgi:hypothetical protein
MRVLKYWQARARAEGRVNEMSWADKLAYVGKYLFAHDRSGSPEMVAHFERQKKLLAGLREEGEIGPRLGFVGDIMWIRKGWESFASPALLEHLGDHHGIVGNLETVISTRLPVRDFWPDYMAYNSHPGLLTSLTGARKQSLFAALSFANNHALDQGDEAAEDTLTLLDELKITRSGLQRPGEKNWGEFTRQGVRFGFYAATFGLNDDRLLQHSKLNLNRLPALLPSGPGSIDEAATALAEMKGVDVKIIFLHWGHEFESFPTARQMEVARQLVQAGADLVVGSHSHVAQPNEVLFVNEKPTGALPADCVEAPGGPRRALIFYSLGNFANAMYGFPCRVAQIRSLQFYSHQGKVTFSAPTTRLFYNQHTGGKLNLLPLEEYLSQRGNPPHLLFEAANLRSHIGS